ncbi:hypothetical protein AAG570_012431 [Ranatra chinensis]|uniref:Reverse transcriptase domain-containing protein n=1 Tax=Ranatra chinensis TaxID=642074 RepID=A0ABD0YE41_9HEMI
MHAELGEMLQAGVVEPTKSSWSSPVVMIRKKNGSYRPCMDYQKVLLSEESKERTAFTVAARGFFQFTRMPFGLHNSPASFQRLIDQVPGLELERHVFVNLDDIIAWSAQFDEHVETLSWVFKKLNDAGLTHSLEKCQFW